MEFDLTLGIAVLERTPLTLRSLLRGLGPAWVDATEGPETWSPYVIMGHLILGERANWVARAQLILAQGANWTDGEPDRNGSRKTLLSHGSAGGVGTKRTP